MDRMGQKRRLLFYEQIPRCRWAKHWTTMLWKVFWSCIKIWHFTFWQNPAKITVAKKFVNTQMHVCLFWKPIVMLPDVRKLAKEEFHIFVFSIEYSIYHFFQHQGFHKICTIYKINIILWSYQNESKISWKLIGLRVLRHNWSHPIVAVSKDTQQVKGFTK